jgi:hypothetical protein
MLDVLKWVLRILTAVTVIGPLCLAFTIYHDDLSALIMPRVDAVGIAIWEMPDISHVKYNVTSSKTLLITFNFTNPYDSVLTINGFMGRTFCYEHKVFLGNFSLVEKPVSIQSRKSVRLTLLFNYTDDGRKHIKDFHNGEEYIYVDLEFKADVQGVNLHGNYTNFGPIPSLDG